MSEKEIENGDIDYVNHTISNTKDEVTHQNENIEETSEQEEVPNTKQESFVTNGLTHSQDQWTKILNLQANLHSLAQANLVAQTQERIAKEYGIDTCGGEVGTDETKVNIVLDDGKEYTEEEKPQSQSGNEENHKDKGTEQICTLPSCGRVFSTVGNLKFHLQAVHKIQTHTLECKVEGCNRKFAWPAHYKYHQLTHTGQRLHKCDVAGCEKRFYTSQRLAVHQRCHSGERPFVCPLKGCNKAFSTHGNLQNHKRTHTGEKPFVCEYKGCKRSFAEASSLKKHKLTHTGAKPFVCSICGKAFTQSGSRNVHVKRHQLEGEAVQRQEEPAGGDEHPQKIILQEQNILVLKAEDEILHYKELHSSGETLVFTQPGSDVVSVSTNAAGDQLQTMLAPQAMDESTFDSDIMSSATGANVVVLTQPQDIVSSLHDNQHTNTQEIVYTSDLLPVGLDHEEIAHSISHHDIMGSNVVIGDVKSGEDGIRIVVVPMLEGDTNS